MLSQRRLVWHEDLKAAKLQRIIVPIDFSHESLKALQYALPIAKKCDSTGLPLAPAGAVAELGFVDVASTNFFCSPVRRGP